MTVIDSLPVEILSGILDWATYVPWGLSTDPDSDIYTLPKHPPPSRQYLLASIGKSTTTAISILHVCKLWWTIGLEYRFRYVLLRVRSHRFASPTFEVESSFSFVSDPTLADGTLAYAFFISHAHLIKRLDIVCSTSMDAHPKIDAPTPFMQIYVRFLEPLVTQCTGLCVLATTDLPIDTAVMYDRIFHDVISTSGASNKEVASPLRAIDLHGRHFIESHYPCNWISLYDLPQLHRFRLNQAVYPSPESQASWLKFLEKPRSPPIHAGHLTSFQYLPSAAEICTPSLVHLSIVSSDLVQLRKDRRFVTRYKEDVRSMHVQDYHLTTNDPDVMPDALSQFSNLRALSLTFSSWMSCLNWLIKTSRGHTESSHTGVLPTSVSILGIAIARAQSDRPLHTNTRSLIVGTVDQLRKSPLLSHIHRLRFVDPPTTEEVRQPDQSPAGSRLILQLWTEWFEHRGGVRLEAFDGRLLVE